MKELDKKGSLLFKMNGSIKKKESLTRKVGQGEFEQAKFYC